MGVKDWLKRKGEEKSTSNIVDDLRQLAAAVCVDMIELHNEMVSGQTEALAATVDGRQPWNQEAFTKGQVAFKNRKERVIKAQKKLFENLTIWSTLSPEHALNEVVIPALTSGDLRALSEPYPDAVVVAAYRVCEAVARQKGVNLEAHTPPAILQLVNDAGDLYR